LGTRPNLHRNDDISTAQYDLARTRFTSTAAALQKAEEQLALVQEGPRKEQIEAARAQVAQAQANLQLTEASRLELKRLEQELVTRRAQAEQARAQVSVVEAQLADAVSISPSTALSWSSPPKQGKFSPREPLI